MLHAALFVSMKAHLAFEDDLVVLTSGDAACFERFSIAQSLNCVRDRRGIVRCSKKVRVNAVQGKVLGQCVLRGVDGRADDLSAEDTRSMWIDEESLGRLCKDIGRRLDDFESFVKSVSRLR